MSPEARARAERRWADRAHRGLRSARHEFSRDRSGRRDDHEQLPRGDHGRAVVVGARRADALRSARRVARRRTADAARRSTPAIRAVSLGTPSDGSGSPAWEILAPLRDRPRSPTGLIQATPWTYRDPPADRPGHPDVVSAIPRLTDRDPPADRSRSPSGQIPAPPMGDPDPPEERARHSRTGTGTRTRRGRPVEDEDEPADEHEGLARGDQPAQRPPVDYNAMLHDH